MLLKKERINGVSVIQISYGKKMDSLFEVMKSEGFVSWLLISSLILFSILLVIFVSIRAFYHHQVDKSDGNYDIDEMARKMALKPYEVAQAVFEVLISNTCIVVMMWVYYWITEKLYFMSKFFNILLLILIVVAVIANNIIDNKMEQDMLTKSDKATIRLISSLSIANIFVYIKFKFETSQYDELIMCYIGLILGRFIYLDTTWEQVKISFQSFIKYIIPLVIAMAFTYIVSFYGFKYRVITSNNILVSLACIHFCMILCIHYAKRIVYGKI